MPKTSKRITDTLIKSLPVPESGELIYWCATTEGFGVRVSSTGVKAFVLQRRVEGKDTRRTLGKATGTGAITCEAARELRTTISSELQLGKDRAVDRKAARVEEKRDAVTFKDALDAFVKGKRRGKDGLPLKDRTKDDYSSMVAAGGARKDGTPFLNGPLFTLALKSIHKITADDMRKVHKATLQRGERRATYAMQVLRAVLNWQGVTVPDSPLSKTTAGKNRIVLPPTVGDPRPIPPEKLAAWWDAAQTRAGSVASDACRFILLTGCRPGEVYGSEWESGLLVRDVDLKGGRVTCEDTKNRTNHTVMLSRQAAVILAVHSKDKKSTDKVFEILNPGKTLAAINKDAGTLGITPHKLRHTFASVAEELVSGYALKRMLNHSHGDDVTGGHYVGKSETQLKTAWQTVADFIAPQSPASQTEP